MEKGKCFQHVAESLASHASSQSLQLGKPRKVQDNKNYLVAISEDQCWMLRDGDTVWLSKNVAKGTILPYSSACSVRDEILITGGWKGKTSSKHCSKLSLPSLECTVLPDFKVARRFHASLCVWGQVYVLGGDSDSKRLQSVKYLDEKTGSWRGSSTRNLPVPLCIHTAVNYQHHIYVFGGRDSLQKSRATFVLDNISKKWQTKLTCQKSGHMDPL